MQNGKTGGDSPQTPQPIEIPAAKIPTFIAGGGTTVDKEVTDLQIGETEKNLASAIPQQPLTETAPQSTSGSDMPIQASGTEGLFTDRTSLSQQATSSLQEAAAANAPPELTYASEEEGLAAHQAAEERRQREAYQEELSRQQNELEQQRRDQAVAAAETDVTSTPAVYGPGGDYVLSGVSGYSGGERIRLDHVTKFMDRIAWAEESNRPCLLANLSGAKVLEFKHCDRTFDLLASWPDHKSVGGLGLIRSLRVCNNNKDNKRLKGIQIWGAAIDDNGNRVDQPESTYESNANCATWGEVVRCPSGKRATGLLIHANDAAGAGLQIVGLELICRGITQTN